MALELIKQVGLGKQVEIVDIAFDDELFSRYGVTIPVVKVDESEINWPFDILQLQQWLTVNGITYHP
ncbi:thiol-disulfide isomerase and thioredoxin [Vibrio maritimus]|uniref:Thiol-disulfide isomerase and thioredoxin n=1 Tax=Vibrio maritimus TaxID=990268 RepID=A0A090T6P7_9VIBR|nr:thiol-disulfide isomerase and thioredoxin [Vibrio maritimus]